MTIPLKVYNSGVGLQQMTDAEIDSRIVPLILEAFAADNTASVRGNVSLRNDSLGNSGNISNRLRNNDVGDHPVDASSFTTTTHSFHTQNTVTQTTDSVKYPLKWVTSGSKLQEMSTADLQDRILQRTAAAWKNNTYPVGGYHFGVNAPDSDTWTSVGSFTETFRQTGEDSSIVYHLRRKTGPLVASGPRPVHANKTDNASTGAYEYSDADLHTLAAEFRNYLFNIESIGDYNLVTGSSAPGVGTWVQVGSYIDYLTDVGDQVYSSGYGGIYSGSFEGVYSNQYEGGYSGNFEGGYSGNFEGYYSGQYAGIFSRGYEGFYSQGFSGGYQGGYQGPYEGNYSNQYRGGYAAGYQRTFGSGGENPNPRAELQGGTYSSTYSGIYSLSVVHIFSGIFSGLYSGQYSNQYTGTYINQYEGFYSQGYEGVYSRMFEGIYSQEFLGMYSLGYTGIYVGNFAGVFSNQYTGATVLSSLSNQAYTFWKRIA